MEGRSVTAAAARVRPDGSRIFAGEDISVLSKVADVLRAIRAQRKRVQVGKYGHIGVAMFTRPGHKPKS